eukprot:Sdes_comp20912_c1_seq1m18178
MEPVSSNECFILEKIEKILEMERRFEEIPKMKILKTSSHDSTLRKTQSTSFINQSTLNFSSFELPPKKWRKHNSDPCIYQVKSEDLIFGAENFRPAFSESFKMKLEEEKNKTEKSGEDFILRKKDEPVKIDYFIFPSHERKLEEIETKVGEIERRGRDWGKMRKDFSVSSLCYAMNSSLFFESKSEKNPLGQRNFVRRRIWENGATFSGRRKSVQKVVGVGKKKG